MFSQKSILGSALIILFLLDIFQGVLLLRVQGNSRTEITAMQLREAEGAASLRAGILSEDVQMILDTVRGSSISRADMYVLIPPESCRACATRQSALICEAGKKHPEKEICMFVPREELVDYRAYFSEEKNIIIESYCQPEPSELDLFQSLSGNFIIMILESGRVWEYYITDRLFPEASRIFMSKVLDK